MLQLWIENDGRTAHLVNEAGGKVVSGRIVPGVAMSARGGEFPVGEFRDGMESGTEITCALQFEGTVI